MELDFKCNGHRMDLKIMASLVRGASTLKINLLALLITIS